MKLHGQKICAEHKQEVVFERPVTYIDKEVEVDGVKSTIQESVDNNIKLTVVGIADDAGFEQQCAKPNPPMVLRAGGQQSLDLEDSGYNDELLKWAGYKAHWMILKSLAATDGLEWETVDWADPTTWGNYVQELQDTGFTPYEIAKLINAINEVNGISSLSLEKAQRSFLPQTGA